MISIPRVRVLFSLHVASVRTADCTGQLQYNCVYAVWDISYVTQCALQGQRIHRRRWLTYNRGITSQHAELEQLPAPLSRPACLEGAMFICACSLYLNPTGNFCNLTMPIVLSVSRSITMHRNA